MVWRCNSLGSNEHFARVLTAQLEKAKKCNIVDFYNFVTTILLGCVYDLVVSVLAFNSNDQCSNSAEV